MGSHLAQDTCPSADVSIRCAGLSQVCTALGAGECSPAWGTAGRRCCLLRKQTSTLLASAFPGRISCHIPGHGPPGLCPSNPWFPASTHSRVSSKPASPFLQPKPYPKPSYLLCSRSQGKATLLLGALWTPQKREKSVLGSLGCCGSSSK